MAQEMCNIHPDKEVVDVCTHCGRKVCVSCAATLAGKTYCFECIKLVEPSLANQEKQILWENRGQEGLFGALVKTWTDIVFHPKKFFAEMPTKAGIKNPLLFTLICGSIAITFAALINIVSVLSGGTMPNVPAGTPAPPVGVAVGSYVALIVFSPLLVALGVFIGTGIYHLVVLMFGGKEGFFATFRVLSYTNALAVFNILPIVGPIFVTGYSIVMFVIGFKNVHKMSTGRAVIVAILPMIVLFVIGFVAAFYLASQSAVPALTPTAPAAVTSSAPAAITPVQ